MKKLLILLLITATFISCKRKNVWTKAYEKQVYTTVYDGLGSIMKDSSQRKDFALYMVSKFKTTLPYGIESVPNDSLKLLSKKIGEEYEASHKTQDFKAIIPWSDETILALRSSMERHLGDKFSKQVKDEFCDCVIADLRKVYPDSLVSPVPDSVIDSADNICLHTLIKK